jgi:hypothetical protein
MALIDAIVSAVANLKPRRIMSLVRQADEEQRRGFRWSTADY